MKKLHTTIIFALLIAITFTACHTGSHVIISSNDNNTSIKLEYWGTVTLNNDKTAIESISPNGYIQYTKNDDKLYISPAPDGRLTYKFNDDKNQNLSPIGRAFLTEAVQKIAKVQSGH